MLRRGFCEDLHAAAAEAVEELVAEGFAEGDQLGYAALGDGAGNLVVHVGGGCALPGAEAEDVDLGEADLFGCPAGGGEIGLGFAREPDDDVGGEGGLVEGRGDLVALPDEMVCPIAASHAVKDCIGAALKGEVQVRADAIGMVGEDGDQLGG